MAERSIIQSPERVLSMAEGTLMCRYLGPDLMALSMARSSVLRGSLFTLSSVKPK